MNIVDSCAWLAYFADEPNAEHFYAPLRDADSLVVPTITTYEVFKVVLRESGENEALQAVAAMQKGNVVDLTVKLSMAASKLSLLHKLPMADSIILATSQEFGARIWTQDSDFEKISGVMYFPKQCPSRNLNSRMEEIFRNKVFKLLLKKEKITGELVGTVAGWRHSGFNAFCGSRIQRSGTPNQRRWSVPHPMYTTGTPASVMVR